MGINRRLRWLSLFVLLFSSVAYAQNMDSLLLKQYENYKQGSFNDSTLSILHHAGLINENEYLEKLYGKTSLDSIRLSQLRSRLKYKFVLDFLSRARPDRRYLDKEMEQGEEHFAVNAHKPEGALESFGYYLLYNLYSVQSFNGRDKLYLLTSSDIDGLVEFFLFDDSQHDHKLLDTLDLNPQNDPDFDFFLLSGHSIVRLRQSIHGSGYLDKQEAFIGMINKKFHNLFSTDLLQANDWTMSPADTLNNFDRWTAQITYIHKKGKGMPNIKKDVTEDMISMDGVRDFDFANGRVIKHIRSWVELYVWDSETKSFVLNKKLSGTGDDTKK